MDIFSVWIDLDRFGSCKFDLQMLKCWSCRWSCMFGNDSGFGCMLDRFWYACLDTFGAIFDTKKNFQPFWLFLDRFVYAWTNLFMHVWTDLDRFWYACFGTHVLKHFCGHICLCIFGEIYDTKNCNYKWIYVDRFGYLLPNLSLTSLVHSVCPF